MKIIKDYFYLNRAERNAMTVLLVLIAIVNLLPFIYKAPEQNASDLSLLLKLSEEYKSGALSDKDSLSARSRFAFDPNTATYEELKDLGFSSAIARRIQSYRNSGREFKYRSDLFKIYSVDSDFVREIYTLINLPDCPERKDYRDFYKSKSEKKFKLCELNTADTNALIALPGIGSRLAQRIVSYRERLGGFYSVDQLFEVYGLDSAYKAAILKRVFVDPNLIRKININKADKEELSRHLYIGYRSASILLEYRKQHGNFKTVVDISNSKAIMREKLDKLIPYIIFISE